MRIPRVNRRTILAGGPAAVTGALLSQPSHAAESIAAQAIRPSDPRYAAMTVGNNARWRAQPDQVVLVTDAQQVLTAVRRAVDGGKRLSVRSGGHCYENFV